jgi:DNA polymerase III subunit epsilon
MGGIIFMEKGGISLHPLDFTAIDFETANHDAHSACQLGIAVVQAGEIVERKSWLIRPPSDQFYFTYIHGIAWHHVAGEPDFGQLWLQIRPYMEARVIAAHNAPFDLGVFFALIKLYRIDLWRGGAIDSVTVARRTWPLLANHQLPTVASHLRIPLDHHNAASDASACAQIICRAEREKAGVVEKAIRWYGGK